MNEKVKKLPRFSYQVPEDLTQAMLSEMREEYRETTGDCITAILRKYFERKAHEKK